MQETTAEDPDSRKGRRVFKLYKLVGCPADRSFPDQEIVVRIDELKPKVVLKQSAYPYKQAMMSQ